MAPVGLDRSPKTCERWPGVGNSAVRDHRRPCRTAARRTGAACDGRSGPTENSIRQVVRTPEGRVYIAAADDEGLNTGPAATLRMFRAGQTGAPPSFAQADAAGAPRVTPGHTIGGGDAHLDRSGQIHVVFLRTDFDAVINQTFSTLTDRWGPPETGDWESRARRAPASVTAGVWWWDWRSTPRAPPRLPSRREARPRPTAARAAAWEAATVGSGDLNPSLSFDRAGRLHAAWLDEPNTIRYARRDADGAWRATNSVVATGVLENGNRDQGPALAVDARNDPVVLYLTGIPGADDNYVRPRTLTDGSWVPDDPTAFIASLPAKTSTAPAALVSTRSMTPTATCSTPCASTRTPGDSSGSPTTRPSASLSRRAARPVRSLPRVVRVQPLRACHASASPRGLDRLGARPKVKRLARGRYRLHLRARTSAGVVSSAKAVRFLFSSRGARAPMLA